MKENNVPSLYEKLEEYSKENFYPFHMPGHKRVPLFDRSYSIDITEIHDFDDLHHPEGILKEKMESAAKFYGADQSFYLVNGSTAGILSAISAVTEIGDEILIARNCHKSVFHAVFLRKLKPYYVYPNVLEKIWINGGISPIDIENQLKLHPNIKAVVIVSPTYEGIVSDIKTIVEISHQYGVPLIVDEAHGAHFIYGVQFPKSALECGADVVIQSLHKTLPSMTQTAILHKKGNLVSIDQLKFYLQVYQTSSPSYVLMASIDSCLIWMKENARVYMMDYDKKLKKVYKELDKLKNIWHLSSQWIGKSEILDWDCSKIVFGSRLENWSGERIMNVLREEYHLEMEMSAPNYVVAMTSVMDCEEGVNRLVNALKALDQRMCVDEKERMNLNLCHKVDDKWKLSDTIKEETRNKQYPQISPEFWNFEHEIVLSPYEASLKEKELVSLEKASGRICAQSGYIYPPGIPFIMPGERLERKDMERVLYYQTHGFEIRGGLQGEKNYIYVIK